MGSDVVLANLECTCPHADVIVSRLRKQNLGKLIELDTRRRGLESNQKAFIQDFLTWIQYIGFIELFGLAFFTEIHLNDVSKCDLRNFYSFSDASLTSLAGRVVPWSRRVACHVLINESSHLLWHFVDMRFSTLPRQSSKCEPSRATPISHSRLVPLNHDDALNFR